jgi:hypothetical protein
MKQHLEQYNLECEIKTCKCGEILSIELIELIMVQSVHFDFFRNDY